MARTLASGHAANIKKLFRGVTAGGPSAGHFAGRATSPADSGARVGCASGWPYAVIRRPCLRPGDAAAGRQRGGNPMKMMTMKSVRANLTSLNRILGVAACGALLFAAA